MSNNNRVLLKKSSVAGKVPINTDIEVAELAINLNDKVLYSKDIANSVFQVKANPIDSASLTGTPTAPTAPIGTANAQIATTEFVNQAVSSISTTSDDSIIMAIALG
jgi:hypothetical protein